MHLIQHKLIICLVLILSSARQIKAVTVDENYKIPNDFLMGVATASYQIEGAWDEDGKGENIWDNFTHSSPDKYPDNGDITCDSYHKYLEDVAMVKYLGVSHYRFSVSWARVLPKGDKSEINTKGVEYYKNLIKALKTVGVEPMITLYHWDLPQALQDKGGWESADMVNYFADYAEFCYEQFGDDVKYWFTFNEPKQVCHYGYGNGYVAPGVVSDGLGEYQCVYVVLKAHAAAYHRYGQLFREKQKGKISFVVDATWVEPMSDSAEDKAAAIQYMEFDTGIYANPVYHPEGNFPKIVIDRIAARSSAEEFVKSRLPEFTTEEISYIKGTYDFFGLNTYFSKMANASAEAPIGTPSFVKDRGVSVYDDPSWSHQGTGWPIVPWGMRKLLVYLSDLYGKPEMMITENGYADTTGTLNDPGRTDYYREYMTNVLQAKEEDGVKVIGYTAWSLMDNLEWIYGFNFKFGLYQVNFSDPDRTRAIKDSGKYYRSVVLSRSLNGSHCLVLNLSLIVIAILTAFVFSG